MAYSSRLQFNIEEVRQKLKSIKSSQRQRKKTNISFPVSYTVQDHLSREWCLAQWAWSFTLINNQDNHHRESTRQPYLDNP